MCTLPLSFVSQVYYRTSTLICIEYGSIYVHVGNGNVGCGCTLTSIEEWVKAVKSTIYGQVRVR